MVYTMATQRTASRVCAQIYKIKLQHCIWRNDIDVEIDEMGVVGNAMGVVTGRAGRITPTHRPHANMTAVRKSAGISCIQDTAAIMTLVTHGVFVRTLYGIIRRCVVALQDIFIHRPMRSAGPDSEGRRIIITVVTVCTVDNAAYGIRG